MRVNKIPSNARGDGNKAFVYADLIASLVPCLLIWTTFIFKIDFTLMRHIHVAVASVAHIRQIEWTVCRVVVVSERDIVCEGIWVLGDGPCTCLQGALGFNIWILGGVIQTRNRWMQDRTNRSCTKTSFSPIGKKLYPRVRVREITPLGNYFGPLLDFETVLVACRCKPHQALAIKTETIIFVIIDDTWYRIDRQNGEMGVLGWNLPRKSSWAIVAGTRSMIEAPLSTQPMPTGDGLFTAEW